MHIDSEFEPFIPPQPCLFFPSASGLVGSPSTQQPYLLFVQSNNAVDSGGNMGYKITEEKTGKDTEQSGTLLQTLSIKYIVF